MVRTWLQARVVAVVAATCCVAGGMVVGVPGLAVAPAAASSAVGASFVPLGPVRVLDTRTGTGGHSGPVGPGKAISLQVSGVGGVPASGVTAVVLNVTATDPTASSFVTVYPDGRTRPDASNLNFTRGETIPNLVVTPVGADGKVDFYNSAGSVNLIADLAGYYTDSGGGSLLGSLGPVRVMDTRNGTGVAKAPVGPGKAISLQVSGVGGVPASGVTAVVLNVTATDPTASSFVTVYADGQARPVASNLNFSRGETIPNLVVVPVGADGKVDFYNSAGSVNLFADLSGYYTAAGAGFAPLGPVRVMDTRNGTGVAKAPVGPGKAISLQVSGVDGVAASGVTAVVLNVTATDPTASSFVTVYPDGGTRPVASNLNFTRGETIPNLVVVPVGADGKVDFYNSAGSVNLVADLAGYYTAGGAPWADAIEVPGTAALNTGGVAQVFSVSCASAGNCAAGGSYTDGSGNSQAFVADEVDGTWGDAIEVPGTAAVNTLGSAQTVSVSCASAGNCAAGGYYDNASAGLQAFVADEVDGTWGDAIEVPGTATLNTGDAQVDSVSCASAGNCAAGGSYTDSSDHSQAFVADEVDGTWGNAIEVPGTATLNTGSAGAFSVSCASAGNCAAGGSYTDGSDNSQAFVVSEVNGSWGDAIEVPGTAALNTGGSAGVNSVSCASAGNCAAGGAYTNSSSVPAFVVSEVNGTWGDAIEVPGIAAFNAGDAFVASVSCASAGNCAAGGSYTDSAGNSPAFVVSEVNGTWGDAMQVPGIVPGAGTDLVTSVSCPSAGNCAAGGSYTESGGNFVAFVVSEVNGSWGDAIQVPGTPAASVSTGAEVNSVSCPPAGSCAAGGGYHDPSSAGDQAFVVGQN
jgi:hypothetical protein